MKWGSLCVLCASLLVALGRGGNSLNPCQDYTVISDGHRSVSFVPGPHDSHICDAYTITEGSWYRFQHSVGGKMPEYCVKVFHCGTQAPIWMNGQHPTEYEKPVKRQVCANYGYPHDCCTWKATIQVVRCFTLGQDDDYYVYKLVRPPGCPYAYCAGNQRSCPGDTVYNNRTQRCEKKYPEFKNVTLLPPVVEDNAVRFYCSFSYASSAGEDGAMFEVNFYFDQVKHPNASVLVAAPVTKAALKEQFLRFNMGKYLTCGVRSYWSG